MYKSMISPRQLFHMVSYLQYPLMASSMVFYIPFVISLVQGEPNWSNLNNVLILIGVAISFSTLQDTTKTQNNFSRKVWESPRKGKIALVLFSLVAFILIIGGLASFYLLESDSSETIAVGITVLGIGFMGLLKSAIEMFESHRFDKNQPVVEALNDKEVSPEFENSL